MFIYFILILIPGFGALFGSRRASFIVLLFYVLLLSIAVGLRHKVGMDWNNYIIIQQKISLLEWQDALRVSEPGFALIALLSENFGFGIYGTNLFAGVMFAIGLVGFARSTQNAWLALVASVPYLVTAVAMSASRQSAALGMLLLAFSIWRTSSTATRVTLILFASTFHVSVVFCLAFVVLDSNASHFRKALLLMIILVIMLFLTPIADQFEYYSRAYIGDEFIAGLHSPGALIHVALVAVPGVLFLLYRRQWTRAFGPDPLLFSQAVLSLLAVPGVFVASTAVDRMSLYLYSLPMALYAGLPYLIGRAYSVKAVQVGVVVVHVVVLIGWLVFSNSAVAYVPYANLLLG